MKQEELLGLLTRGHVVVVGQYAGCVRKSREYTDRETGRTRQLRGITHTLIAGGRPVMVDEYLPDGTDVEAHPVLQKAGKSYVVDCESVKEEKGVLRVRLNGTGMSELVL